MKYSYLPIYKYVLFFVIILIFFNQYKQINNNKYLIVSIVFTIILVILDYTIIEDHPSPFEMKKSELFDPDILDDIIDYDHDYDL